MAKKVEVKKEIKKSEIKAKKVGKNLTVVIDGVKIVKPNITDKDLKSISSKILLYNKVNSEARLKEIHKLLQGEVAKEKEVKQIKEKAIKKVIKKASTKKISKDKSEEPIDLIAEVRKAHANREITDEEIETLQDLINKKKEEKVKQEQENPTQEAKDDGSRSRERYR